MTSPPPRRACAAFHPPVPINCDAQALATSLCIAGPRPSRPLHLAPHAVARAHGSSAQRYCRAGRPPGLFCSPASPLAVPRRSPVSPRPSAREPVAPHALCSCGAPAPRRPAYSPASSLLSAPLHAQVQLCITPARRRYPGLFAGHEQTSATPFRLQFPPPRCIPGASKV